MRSLASAGAVIPDADIRLARSALSGRVCPVLISRREALSAPEAEWIMVPDRTERGSDSRLPPNIEAGARAFMDALVSTEFRRRRFEDDARVRIEASSVRTLLAVAVWYVVG